MHNLLRTAVALLGERDEIALEDLPEDFLEQAGCGEGGENVSQFSAAAKPGDFLLADMEDRVISTTLARTGGNIAETARKLGISRSTLYRKLRGGNVEEASGSAAV